MSRAGKRKQAAQLPPPEPPSAPASPLIGCIAVVRGIVEHVTPGGSVCLATSRGYIWVLLDELEAMPAQPLDPDLFG